MKALRATLAILVIAASGFTIARVTIPRFTCNIEKSSVRAVTRAHRIATDFERTTRARDLAARCRRCLAYFPDDYNFQFMLALNEEMMGRFDDAVRSYERALELNERPEIYSRLGLLRLRMGDTERARADLFKAALFDLEYAGNVSEPMQSELYAAVNERNNRLKR
jgi:tetratricopeptide (TPR) repeat protein